MCKDRGRTFHADGAETTKVQGRSVPGIFFEKPAPDISQKPIWLMFSEQIQKYTETIKESNSILCKNLGFHSKQDEKPLEYYE